MSYLEQVIKASGGHAAPEENLEEEIPEGYHRMPDGTIMKDSEHENEAALEKDSDDPCWKGYVQVGMKEKNGKRVPNCVPSASTIDYIVASHNAEFGEARHVSTESAYNVARAAADKYSELDCEALGNAILWELDVFMEYATTGASEYENQMFSYSEQLPEGHPSSDSSLVASAKWLAGAAEIDESSRSAIFYALTEPSGSIGELHATTRLNVLVSSGKLSPSTVEQILRFSSLTSQVD